MNNRLNEHRINRIICAYKRKRSKEGKDYSLDNFLDFIDNTADEMD